jgi:zinc protease
MTKSKTSKGSKFILLPDPSSQLVFIDIAFQAGSILDPLEKSGLSSMALSMLLRGTKKKSSQEFHQKLDELGADLYLGKYMESTRIVGEVLAENLAEFFGLIEEMLSEPAYSPEEFEKLRQQTLSALQDELGSDGHIADRRFQEYILAGHPYGRITSGSLESIKKLKVEDAKNFYRENLGRSNVLFAATGNFKKAEMEKHVRALMAALPGEGIGAKIVDVPQLEKGRELILVNKPDRTQSQIYIGTRGIPYSHPDYHGLMVANHVFGGGSFSAWLMKEVREKRGWSYGAYGGYRMARSPLYYSMHTTPSNKDTVGATKLMIQLFERFVKKGISKAEFDFAKKSLINQSAFQQDTPKKRLNNIVNEKLLGLPRGFYDHFQKNLRKTSYKKAIKSIRNQFNPSDLFILVLGSTEFWGEGLRKIPGIQRVREVSYDAQPGAK